MPTVTGRSNWRLTRNSKGNREYKIVFQVLAAASDGPANVIQTPGLPVFGSTWFFSSDADVWAWCRWDANVTPKVADEQGVWWDVEFTFSTETINTQQCQDTQITDPLLIPQKVSGTFVKYQEEGAFDKNHQPIVNSAFERIHGPQNEWDHNRPSVRIEQNVAALEIDVFSPMVDTLNKYPLWGFPARCIKLSNATWERKFQGVCYVYYTRTFDFDISVYFGPYGTSPTMSSGFDRHIIDEGTKVLPGYWDLTVKPPYYRLYSAYSGENTDGSPGSGYNGNRTNASRNPAAYERFTDVKENMMRAILDGGGGPVDVRNTAPYNTPGDIFVQKYEESDFTTLGIPTSF